MIFREKYVYSYILLPDRFSLSGFLSFVRDLVGRIRTSAYANFQQRKFLAAFTMYVFFIRCSLSDIHIFQITGSDDVISWIIDKILTLFEEFWNRFSCEVVRPLILIRKHNLWG